MSAPCSVGTPVYCERTHACLRARACAHATGVTSEAHTTSNNASTNAAELDHLDQRGFCVRLLAPALAPEQLRWTLVQAKMKLGGVERGLQVIDMLK